MRNPPIRYDDHRWRDAQAFIDARMGLLIVACRKHFGSFWREELGVCYEAAVRLARSFRSEEGDHDANKCRWRYVDKYLFARCVDLAFPLRRRRLQPDVPLAEVAEAVPARASREDPDYWEWLIRGLIPAHRMVAELRYQRGLSYDEVGRVLGVSKSQVGLLLDKVHAHVRERVAQSASESSAAGGAENRIA